MVEKLTKIHRDPHHYAGYFLTTVKGGSLGKHGDSHSEQNHSSVVAHLGQGGSLSIREQINALINRHKNRIQKKTSREASLQVSIALPYTSSYANYEAVADYAARKILSEHAYEKFFKKSIEKARKFESRVTNQNVVLVWPSNQGNYDNTPSNERKTFIEGERCPCYYSYVFNVQCAHEFAVTKIFQKELYDDRWYNWSYYCDDVQDMRSRRFFDKQESEENSDDMNFLDDSFCMLADSDDNNDSQEVELANDDTSSIQNINNVINPTHDDGMTPESNAKQVTFSSLLSVCTELCKTIQNDKMELTKVYASITEAIKVYRRGGRVFFNIETDGGEDDCNSLRAVSTSIPNATRMKRKISAREYRMKKIQRKGFACSQLSQGEDDDDNFLQAPNVKTKTCTLCRQPRHTLMSCDKLTCYRRPMLARNDEKVRSELATCLLHSDIYKTCYIKETIKEDIINKLPMGVKALILMEKYKYEDESRGNNILLRCTLLFEEGRSNMMYHKKLFTSDIIIHWITKSKSNIVVNDIPFKDNE